MILWGAFLNSNHLLQSLFGKGVIFERHIHLWLLYPVTTLGHEAKPRRGTRMREGSQLGSNCDSRIHLRSTHIQQSVLRQQGKISTTGNNDFPMCTNSEICRHVTWTKEWTSSFLFQISALSQLSQKDLGKGLVPWMRSECFIFQGNTYFSSRQSLDIIPNYLIRSHTFVLIHT